jgi:hypothetical protein
LNAPTPTSGGLALKLALVLIIGAPMALVLWHSLSAVLAGEFPGGLLLASLLILPLFSLLALRLARIVRRAAGEDA